MSIRITLEDDEKLLIKKLLDRAIGQRSSVDKDLAELAIVTYDRLYKKLYPNKDKDTAP